MIIGIWLLGRNKAQKCLCFIVMILKMFCAILHLLKVLPLFKDLLVTQGLAPDFEFTLYEILLCNITPVDASKKSQREGKYIPEQLLN